MAFLDQALTASPSVKAAVRVELIDDRCPYKGAFLLGEATLDKDINERVLLDFNKLRIPGKDLSSNLKASGHSIGGEAGLLGEFHSNEAMYFGGEFLAAGAAGFADATIQRNQTAFGQYQTVPGVDTAAKGAVVNAMSKTADRFAEKQRQQPGYTTVRGGQRVYVLFTAVATEE